MMTKPSSSVFVDQITTFRHLANASNAFSSEGTHLPKEEHFQSTRLHCGMLSYVFYLG